MTMSVSPVNLNSNNQNFSKLAISNNRELKNSNSVSFSGAKDTFIQDAKSIGTETEKIAKKEFKQLKKKATSLGLQVDKKDTIETLGKKVEVAYKDDEILRSHGYVEPYFSLRLGYPVTNPVDKMFARFIDNLPTF